MDRSKLQVPANIKLVGFAGRAGSGKDTAANLVGFYKSSFARPLKHACAALFGLMPKDFNEPQYKEQIDPYWGISPRQMAQFFGTEVVRNHMEELLPGIGKDFWVYRQTQQIKQFFGEAPINPTLVAITDVRFQNEYDWIISNGGIIIHITRPDVAQTVGIPNHPSEAGIPNIHTPERTFYVNNTGTIAQLQETVKTIISTAFPSISLP